MAVTQQQIINALVPYFAQASGLDVYDTSAPYGETTPVADIVVLSDPPEDAMLAGPTNTAHGITFEFSIYQQRAVGPASIRAIGDATMAIHQTSVPGANNGITVVRCLDRGGPVIFDNNMLVLKQTWFYQGDF